MTNRKCIHLHLPLNAAFPGLNVVVEANVEHYVVTDDHRIRTQYRTQNSLFVLSFF